MRSQNAVSTLSRRAFVSGALATGAMLALAGCNKDEVADAPATGDDDSAEPSATTTREVPDDGAIDAEGVANGVEGGTMTWFITSPTGIEPFFAEEVQGVQVMYQLFDTLTTYDWATSSMKPLACESYESNDDATQFTFHLRKDATFHNGRPTTSTPGSACATATSSRLPPRRATSSTPSSARLSS